MDLNLTENEGIVLGFLKENIDDNCPTVAYSEIVSSLNIESKQLRGVIASLLKKQLITHDYEHDAQMSFVGLRFKKRAKKNVHFNVENVSLQVLEYDNYIYLLSLVTKSEFRKQGYGTIALKEVIAYAKKIKKPILCFATKELGNELEQLEKWYSKHGFYKEWNKIDTDYNYNFRYDVN